MKIAVINSPFSSHIGRMEFVFNSLQEAGHDIELWGSGASKAIAARSGFTFRDIKLGADYERTMQRKLKPHEFYTEVFFPMAKEQLTTVLGYCEQHAPDCLSANTRVYSAAIASALTGIPLINHNPNGFSFCQTPEDLYGFCAKGSESPRQKSVMENLSREFFAMTDDWFNTHISRKVGLEEIKNSIGYCSDFHVLATSIEELSRKRITQLPNVTLVGPIMTESRNEIDFAHLRPYCYLSLGTCPWSKSEILDRYRLLAEAIPRRYRVVIGLGNLLKKEELNIQDERVAVLEKAPQIEAIRHCEFVVCHGGSQTVHEALHHGKPLIGIPYHAELSEMVNSVEINRAGVRIQPAQLNKETIEAAVERVTSTEVADNAHRLSVSSHRSNAHQSILDLFESVAK